MPESATARQTDFPGLNRRALSGFLISGLQVSFLGAILPVWRYHLESTFLTIGYYFLFLNLGVLVAARLAQILLARKGIRFVLISGLLFACGSFLYLAAVGPPWPAPWRDAGLFTLGISTGLLNAAIFHAISPLYKRDPAATVNLSGILLGLGCVMTALIASGTFYVYNVGSILILFAVVPGLFAIYCARSRFAAVSDGPEPPIRVVVRNFSDPAAILFSLLLFFQFGNEWTIAGWLPIFLIRRLGVSPETALLMLALYWTALLTGRILAQVALERIAHLRLLAGSAIAALLGCLALSVTPASTGAAVAILLVGFGFASIYPIVVERIGHRFTYYHPGFYNGIFSFALSGGLLAPWTLGYFAEAWGIRTVMLIPTIGTCIVVVLVLLITLRERLR